MLRISRGERVGALGTHTTAILLAAGLSARMGGDKLSLVYQGKTLLERAVGLLHSLPCGEKIIVADEQRLGRIALPEGIAAVVNRNPQAGQSESLRLGLGAANPQQQWYLFLGADQPCLGVHALHPMFELAQSNPGKIIHPLVGGQPCSPVMFAANFREALLAQTGDAGGRAVRAANAGHCVTFTPGQPDDFLDIDTPDDYRRLTGG